MTRKVESAYLQSDEGQHQLIIVFADGEHVAQDINEDSYRVAGWKREWRKSNDHR